MASPAASDYIATARVDPYRVASGNCIATLPEGPQHHLVVENLGNGGAADSEAAVIAGPTGVAGSGRSFSRGSSGSTTARGKSGACWRGEVVFDDFVITGPGPTVTTQVSARMQGLVVTSETLGAGVFAQVTGLIGGPGSAFAAFDMIPGGLQESLTIEIDQVITTPDFTVPVDTPFSVRLRLEGEMYSEAGWNPDIGGPARAEILEDMQSAIRFVPTPGGAPDAPLFEVPPGHSVYSESANVVDNRVVNPEFVSSPDTTLGFTSFAPVADEEAANDDGVTLAPVDLGPLPPTSDVVALALDTKGDRLFVLEGGAVLPGPLSVRKGDVVRYDGSTYTLELDADALGIPATVGVDALTLSPAGYQLSFDGSVDLGAFRADKEDLVEWDGAAFSLVFDGSEEGVPIGLDLDAVHLDGALGALVSFDAGGAIGDLAFGKDDVLRHAVGIFALEIDPSGARPAWWTADLDALSLPLPVPEPGAAMCLAAGSVLLVALARRRGRRTGPLAKE